jgi:CHASE2 domain-containing sensor protein
MRKLTFTTLFKVPETANLARQHKTLTYLIHSVVITLLSLFLAHFVIYDLENIATFISTEKNDFQMSDIYNRIADYRSVSYVSPHVTVVSVDQCSTQDILNVLQMVSEYDPSTIGLDIFFRTTSDDSLTVLNTLSYIPNLVLPCKLERTETGAYEHIKYSFVENHLDANYAYVNLNATSTKDMIRDFTPRQITSTGDTLLQMATAMAQIAAPEPYQELCARNNPIETIKYSSVDIPTISADLLLHGDNYEYLSRYLTGRAILLGDVDNINDMYATPINPFIPGVMIHAYALHTIISGQYTRVTPEWINWLIAIIIGIGFIFANMLIKDRWSHMGNLLMRCLQIVLMFGIVYIGSCWYKAHMQYIDFSLVVLMIGFSALAVDVYDGVWAIGRRSIKLINNYKNKKNK